jgi:uncharacterized small protein (DUF1192 family)
MGAREVGGTVVKVALGAAVGVALMLVRDGSRGPAGSSPTTAAHANESSDRPRAPAGNEPTHLEVASAPSPAAGDVVTAVVERDPAARPAESSGDELDELREQVAALQAEVKRLRAQLADGSARHHALHGLIAANELQHGKLYEEIVGLLVDDPESVAEDPRRMFDLILRLIDETGLAGSKVDDGGGREIAPELAAPETFLSLCHSVNEWNDRDGDDGPVFHVSQDQVTFRLTLRLPKVPEGWIGQPLAVDCELQIQVSTQGDASLSLDCQPDANDRAKPIRWSLNVDRGGASLTRHPYRGDEDSKQVSAAELTKERRWLDRIFQQLMTRAR